MFLGKIFNAYGKIDCKIDNYCSGHGYISPYESFEVTRYRAWPIWPWIQLPSHNGISKYRVFVAFKDTKKSDLYFLKTQKKMWEKTKRKAYCQRSSVVKKKIILRNFMIGNNTRNYIPSTSGTFQRFYTCIIRHIVVRKPTFALNYFSDVIRMDDNVPSARVLPKGGWGGWSAPKISANFQNFYWYVGQSQKCI